MGKQRRYSKEFKLEALQLLEDTDKSIAEVARDLGIPKDTLYTWRKAYMENPETAFPGSGKRQIGNPEEEELYRLRKELAEVTQERDILKKAIAIFSRGPRSRNGS